ncbi:1627_t:CDS:2 [Ambispora gerdemannii]|uniref:1627_t:CDS:1 n=1 Tax=Ambispora gerdemannii TaxID=144530 RepID=A0A9N8WDJ0_9GLOM|nr:1627_t:CDS:2 [Ambispora gerdemannii]
MNDIEYLSETERKLLNKCPYTLTLTIEELTKPAKKIRNNCDKPPRPQNSWIIFRKDFEANIRLRSPGVKQKVKNTANECSLKWKLQSSEVKDFFKILEKMACENHKRIYPNYKYKPKNAKNSNCKELRFREQKKYAFTSSVKFNTTKFNSPQEAMQIDGTSSSLASNSPQEAIQIDGPSFLTFNSPQEAIQIDETSFLTFNSPQEVTQIDGSSSILTTTYDHQADTTITYNQDYNYNENLIGDAELISSEQNKIYETQSSESSIININNDNTSSTVTPQIPLSQPLSQLYMTEYDLSNGIFDNLLYDDFS